MRRTILQEVNPISFYTVKRSVAREQTQQVLPKIYRRGACIGRLCPPDRLRQQIRPFVTVIGIALLTGTTGVLTPQKDDRASAAEPLVSLTRLKASNTTLSPFLSAANSSENSVQPKPIAKPLWVPKQLHKQLNIEKPVGPEPAIDRIHADPTVDYQVQSQDTVETIASNYQIPKQELVKVNRLNNPNVIRVDQVLRIPSSQARSGYAIGGDGSALGTTPSVITAAQPSGVTLPISTSQVTSIPIPVAPTTDDSKFKVAGVTNQPQALQATSSNNQAEATVSSNISVTTRLSQSQVKDLQSDIQKLQAKYSVRGNSVRDNLQVVTAKPSVTTTTQPSSVTHSVTSVRQAENVVVPTIPASKPFQVRSTAAAATRQPQTQGSTPVASENNQKNVTTSTAVAGADLSYKQTELQLNSQKPQDQYWAEPAKAEQSDRTTVALTPKQKSAATLSAGPNFYAPVVERTAFPQLLNPELPPLAPIDTYLPSENLPSHQRYIWPTKGVLTSGYGRRWGRMHRGIDVAAPIGTPVVAAAVGVVVHAGWNSGGYGNLVNVLHPDGSLTRYAHNKKLLVRPGQAISQGQQIAEMGSTGRSTGPHLHFEIHSPGRGAVNPMFYLSRG